MYCLKSYPFWISPPAGCCSVDAVPCRISFERGKERHLRFVAISVGTSGWIVLAEELPLKKHYGVVRVTAPLVGCNVSEPVFLLFTSTKKVNDCRY